jgi:cell wall assembly regulator SMI1
LDDSPTAKSKALIERLKSHWLHDQIRLRPGVSLQQIEAFESRYHVCLPPDLREYFKSVDGMDEGDGDAEWFFFHPLQAVKSVPEELAHIRGFPDYTEIVRTLPDSHSWFVIVDFVFRSAAFAIRLSDDAVPTPVRWIGDGTHHHVVAPSFSDFLEAYLAEPLNLGAGGETRFSVAE